MDDTAYQRFFVQPSQTYHRRYEALRAIFVEERSQREVADEFGFQHSTLRQLAYDFRQSFDVESTTGESPFFDASTSGVRSKVLERTINRRWPTDRSWCSPVRNRCVSEPERRACSCSYRC